MGDGHAQAHGPSGRRLCPGWATDSLRRLATVHATPSSLGPQRRTYKAAAHDRARRFLAVGKLALGLYNCYDAKNWHDVMRVTLARAGPVALAFDCSLVCFGFPFAQARRRGAKSTTGLRSVEDIASFVAESTSIGEGGESFRDLVAQGRLHVEPFPEGAFPARWGEPVATTPSPAPGRARRPRDVAAALSHGTDQLLVFGLGPRGLPKEALDACPAQLEITGRGIHLDTAAALGALPAMVRAHLEHLPLAEGATRRVGP